MANFLLCDSWEFCVSVFILIEYFKIFPLLFHTSIISKM